MMPTDRLEMLKNLVDQNPVDSRTRYMLAMELVNSGDLEGAVDQYARINESDPDYIAAYFHRGQTLERLNRADEAKSVYRVGIEACSRTGDEHSQSELKEALEALG